MTKKQKEELGDFINYLDLICLLYQDHLDNFGLRSLNYLQKKYPKFKNEEYRRELSSKLFYLIGKDGE